MSTFVEVLQVFPWRDSRGRLVPEVLQLDRSFCKHVIGLFENDIYWQSYLIYCVL